MSIRIKKKEAKLVDRYARLWPRDVFDYIVSEPGKRTKYLAKELDILKQPGVYILYRDDIPYYIGKAGGWLWQRLHVHARRPTGRYNNFWNYFSVFVVQDEQARNEVESILIAAFPTANSAKPRIKKEPADDRMAAMWRQRREFRIDLPRVKEIEQELKQEGREEEED